MYGATIMRLIVNPGTGADGSALQCVRDAVYAGYHVDLTIQYWNPMTVAQDADFFRSILGIYGPLAWANSVGNEQELNQGGTTEDGTQYAAVWKAVEPIVATMAPHAIPWGLRPLGGRERRSAGSPGAIRSSVSDGRGA
jgi:hypothetical protein